MMRLVEKVLGFVVGAVFLWLIFIGAYAFIDERVVMARSQLGEDIRAVAEAMKAEEGNPLDGLKEINSEIIGWITIDGTRIDQPIMQTRDNKKYLTRDYTGGFGNGGGAFVDYRNDGLEDEFSIVYGHRMKDGIMFSDITLFADREYFEAHRTGTIYAERGKYSAEVVGFAVLDVATTEIYDIERFRGDSFAAYGAISFVYESGAEVGPGDKLVLLSTCDRDARAKRDILLLKLLGYS